MAFAYSFYITSFIASLISPFWGLVGLVASVLIRFQDRFPAIGAIKPFSILFLGMILSCILHKDKLSTHQWKQDQLLLGMLGLSVFGLMILNPGDLLSQTWEFVSSLAFYYFATRIMNVSRQFIILFAVMSCCIVFLGYEAINDVTMNPKTSVFVDIRNGRWQGIGYYKNANEFGQLMVTTIPFLLAFLLMKTNIIIKLVVIIFISILIYVVGKTGSRTVMVLLGLMVILTFVLRGSGNVIKKSLTGGLVVGLLLFGLSYAPGPIQDRLQTIFSAGSDKSFQGRTRAWDQGFKMVSWYPFTGVGKGQWMDYHGLMPHNSYVQIMAELGPIGIFLFLWIIRLCFKEFKPYFDLSVPDPPKIRKKIVIQNKHPIWDTPIEELKEINDSVDVLETEPVSKHIKTIVIAVSVVFVGWLVYIFLGNQGYAVWTYFYIGLCGAVRNLRPKQISSDS